MFQCSLILILRNERNSNSPQIFLNKVPQALLTTLEKQRLPGSSIPPFTKTQQLVLGKWLAMRDAWQELYQLSHL